VSALVYNCALRVIGIVGFVFMLPVHCLVTGIFYLFFLSFQTGIRYCLNIPYQKSESCETFHVVIIAVSSCVNRTFITLPYFFHVFMLKKIDKISKITFRFNQVGQATVKNHEYPA
jgi:hypothetical protein